MFKVAPKDMDDEEKRYKMRQKIFGNIKLIGELYKRGSLHEKVVKTCLDSLFHQINEEKVENLCHFILKIGKSLYEYYAFDEGSKTIQIKPKIKAKGFPREEFENYLEELISLKSDPLISSRVRFMIQVLYIYIYIYIYRT